MKIIISVLLIMCFLLGCEKRMTGLKPGTLKEMLSLAWEDYKKSYIKPDGRVVRPLDGGDTVSEGQAYAMLLAVWMDDRPVFERGLEWSKRHLSREKEKGDHLLAWHWSEGGVTDWNSASDADLDYALSLLLAYRRWGEEAYKKWAIEVMESILAEETMPDMKGNLYLLPGTWGRLDNGAFVTNPSYYSPAWYRLFFSLTGDKRWMNLLEGAYQVIEKVSMRLGKEPGVGLIPDWCIVKPNLDTAPADGMSSRYGWDAIRVVWRLGIDWTWFKEERARRYLGVVLKKFYEKEWWRRGGKVYIEYHYQGSPYKEYESPASYLAAAFTAFVGEDKDLMGEFLHKAYEFGVIGEDGLLFEKRKDYYSDSLSLLFLTLLAEAAISF